MDTLIGLPGGRTRLMKLGFQFNQQRIGGRYYDVSVFSVEWCACQQGMDGLAGFDEILSLFSDGQVRLHGGVLLTNRDEV